MWWAAVLVLVGCGRIAFDTGARTGDGGGRGNDSGSNPSGDGPSADPQWHPITFGTDPVPPARYSAGIAYDSDRQRVVMYGGICDCMGVYLEDTWEFDGTTWTNTANGGPTALANMTMQYDPNRKRVVLFGGTDGVDFLDDTFEYDGMSWTKVTGSAPPGRVSIASSYNPVLGDVFIYGGTQMTTYLGDTWAYSGAWTEPAVTNPPPPRARNAMAWDGSRSVMFGGMLASATPTNETWTLTGTTWAQLTLAPVPAARIDHAIAGEPPRSRVVMFGGEIAGVPTDETWSFDGAWTQLAAGPSARTETRMVYDAALDGFVLFGGSSTGSDALGDTWILR